MTKYDVISILERLSESFKDTHGPAAVKIINGLTDDIAHYSRSNLNLLYFCQTLDLPGADAHVVKILQNLGVSEIYYGRFRNAKIQLFDFLQELKKLCKIQEKREILEFYIKAVNKRNLLSWRNVFSVLLAGVLGIDVAFISLYWMDNLSAVMQIIASATFFPIVNILGVIGYFGVYIYRRYINKDDTPMYKLREIIARVMQLVLNVLGYSFGLAAVISESVFLATFFILARFVIFINSAINLYYIEKPVYPHHSDLDTLTLEQRQQNERIYWNYIYKKKPSCSKFLG